jgi:methylmalonyl-CoA/ethylmalonyl-CoA epimerase
MSDSWRISHIGVVVKDLESTARALKTLGAVEVGMLKSARPDAPVKVKVQGLKMGDIEIELFQHVEGKTMISDFLEAHGEGVHHVSYFVDDLDGLLNRLGKKPVYGPVDAPDGRRLAFIDAGLPGGMLVELEQLPGINGKD